MNEGFRLLDVFLPDTFEPRSTIRIQNGFRRVSRSLLLGFYFEDDTPLLIWNRNTDLPNKFGMTDPIVWWKHNEQKKEIKRSHFFKFNGQQSSQGNDSEVCLNEKDFQKFEKKLLKEQKEGKYSQLYALDYDLLLKKEEPKVPMYNDYF